jgi:hypothetical protein
VLGRNFQLIALVDDGLLYLMSSVMSSPVERPSKKKWRVSPSVKLYEPRLQIRTSRMQTCLLYFDGHEKFFSLCVRDALVERSAVVFCSLYSVPLYSVSLYSVSLYSVSFYSVRMGSKKIPSWVLLVPW